MLDSSFVNIHAERKGDAVHYPDSNELGGNAYPSRGPCEPKKGVENALIEVDKAETLTEVKWSVVPVNGDSAMAEHAVDDVVSNLSK